MWVYAFLYLLVGCVLSQSVSLRELVDEQGVKIDKEYLEKSIGLVNEAFGLFKS